MSDPLSSSPLCTAGSLSTITQVLSTVCIDRVHVRHIAKQSLVHRRFIEYYNLVFMESNRDAEGKLTPLKFKNIDTGMGLERMAQILQQVPNNYETDLILPIVSRAAQLAGTEYSKCSETDKTALKVGWTFCYCTHGCTRYACIPCPCESVALRQQCFPCGGVTVQTAGTRFTCCRHTSCISMQLTMRHWQDSSFTLWSLCMLQLHTVQIRADHTLCLALDTDM